MENIHLERIYQMK